MVSDAVPEVGHAGVLDDLRPVQLHGGILELIEVGDTTAEQHRHEIDPDLLEQPGVEALPGDAAAIDADDLAVRELFGLVNGGFDAVSDECEVLFLTASRSGRSPTGGSHRRRGRPRATPGQPRQLPSSRRRVLLRTARVTLYEIRTF
jgi:hypothetical protein